MRPLARRGTEPQQVVVGQTGWLMGASGLRVAV